jgi:hypothetical protein
VAHGACRWWTAPVDSPTTCTPTGTTHHWPQISRRMPSPARSHGGNAVNAFNRARVDGIEARAAMTRSPDMSRTSRGYLERNPKVQGQLRPAAIVLM